MKVKIEYEIPEKPDFLHISVQKWKQTAAEQIRNLIDAWITSGTSIAHLSALAILEKQMPGLTAKKLINAEMEHYFDVERG